MLTLSNQVNRIVNRMKNISLDEVLLIVRLFFAVSLLWLGYEKVILATDLQPITRQLGAFAPDPSSINGFMIQAIYGWVEIVIGILLIVGVGVSVAAGVLLAMIVLAFAGTGFELFIRVRDIGLLGGAAMLVLLGAGNLTLPRFLRREAKSAPATQQSTRRQDIAFLFLRLGLAGAFLWFGIAKLGTAEQSGIRMLEMGVIPSWPIVAALGTTTIMLLISTAEIIVGTMLALGLFRRLAAVGSVMLLSMFLWRMGIFSAIMIKDVALLGISIAVLVHSTGNLTLPALFHKGQVRQMAYSQATGD